MRLKSLLVPVDFTNISNDIVDYAAMLAHRLRAQVELLHVVEPMPPTALLERPIDLSEDVKLLEDEAARRLQSLSERFSASSNCRTLVRHGRTEMEILEEADESDIDLLVVGTHGFHGLEKLFLGSTTDRLLRHCEKPMLTLGPGSAAHPDHEACIIYATDFSAPAGLAWAFACEFARRLRARLVALHVVEHGYEGSETRLQGLIQTNDPSDIPKIETALADPPVYRAILDCARENDARLIVMGRHGRGELEHLLLGSSVDRVVRMADCPVLSVPSASRTPG